MALPKKYFEVKDLLSQFPDSRYYFILGGRSTGKTYSVTEQSVDDAIDGKGNFAYVRRFKESISVKNMQALLNVHNNHIFEKTDGKYNRVVFWRGAWYLEYFDWDSNEKVYRAPEPIGYAFALNRWETDKGADRGICKNIILDEALSKGNNYLKDEFSIFQNVVSSLVRDRTDVDTKIFLLANPVSKYSGDYFKMLGIDYSLIDDEENGGITLIKYPDTDMTTVFCYMVNGNIVQDNNSVYQTYFAFPNSKTKSKSITSGIFELDESARLPSGILNASDIIQEIKILFEGKSYKCQIMRYESLYFLHFSPTKEIKPKEKYLTVDTVFDKNAIICNFGLQHPILDAIWKIFATGQVYYSDNATADLIHAFLDKI